MEVGVESHRSRHHCDKSDLETWRAGGSSERRAGLDRAGHDDRVGADVYLRELSRESRMICN